MPTSPGGIPVESRAPLPEAGDCVAGVCVSEPVAALLTALLAAVALGAVTVLVSYLVDARSVVEDERDRLRTERDAFRSFVDRVDELAVGGSPAANVRPSTRPDGGAGATTGAVQAAYRETVMAVPHYGTDYDEPLVEHMATELGPQVAAATRDHDRLTPPLRDGLVGRASDAAGRRTRLVDALDEERAAVERARRRLSEIERTLEAMDDRPLPERSYEELRSLRTDVLDLEADCERLLTERQRSVHDDRRHCAVTDTDLAMQEYVYDPMPVTYPVLAAGAETVDAVRTARRRVERSLAVRG